MSNLSLADFNGVVPWSVRRLVRTDTVTAQGTPTADHINEAGTFAGHQWGLSHGHAHLLHRIRTAMGNGGPVQTMRGTVVADETWIGGKPKNKHQQGRTIRLPGGGRGRAGHATKRTPVLTLVNKTTGEARSRVVRDVTGATLQKALRENVDTSGSVLHTDGWMGYREIGREFVAHEHVDHSSYEYVRGDVSTNQAEGFFSQLKRSLDGTHHRVSSEHLPRYLAEYDYRYSTRRISDSERMARMVRRSDGVRLAYRTVKAS